jgi:hypothetical protein
LAEQGVVGRKQLGMMQVGLQKVVQTVPVDQFVPGQIDAVIMVTVFDDIALICLI